MGKGLRGDYRGVIRDRIFYLGEKSMLPFPNLGNAMVPLKLLISYSIVTLIWL